MTAGSALAAASHQPAFIGFTVPALLPVTASFVAQGGRLQLAMAFMLAVFAGAVTAISRSGGRALVQETRLRLLNADLASRLAASAAGAGAARRRPDGAARGVGVPGSEAPPACRASDP